MQKNSKVLKLLKTILNKIIPTGREVRIIFFFESSFA